VAKSPLKTPLNGGSNHKKNFKKEMSNLRE